MHATRQGSHILLDSGILITFSEEYEVRNSSLRNLLHPPVTPSWVQYSPELSALTHLQYIFFPEGGRSSFMPI
jgi:hypothetical protein